MKRRYSIEKIFQSVSGRVDESFPELALSSNIQVTEDRGFDENIYIKSVFQRKDWWVLLDEFLNDDRVLRKDILSSFTADGFCYYLPFFLAYCSKRINDDRLDVLPDNLVYSLEFPCFVDRDLPFGEYGKKRKACLMTLSDKQKGAVASFLKAYHCAFDKDLPYECEAEKLLKCYWGKYLPNESCPDGYKAARYEKKYFSLAAQALQSAFPRIPLSEHCILTHNRDYEENRYILTEVQQKNWWDLLEDFIGRDEKFRTGVLDWFEADALCYYLPMLLIYASLKVESLDDLNSYLFKLLSYACVDGDGNPKWRRINWGKKEKKVRSYLLSLSHEQREAIVIYLKAWVYEYEDSEAMGLLEGYWDPEWDKQPLPLN